MKIFDCGGICRRKDKTRPLSWLTGLDTAIKWKLIMRINFIAFFLLFTIMHVSASVHAQKITLSIEKGTLKSVFKEIEQQSGFEVWYNNSLLKGTKSVSIKISGELKMVLDKIFIDQPLTYEIVDKTIVIKRKPVSVVEKITKFIKAIKITGTVTDEKGNPLAGVTVRLKGTNTTEVTTNDGKYTIYVPDENSVLQFSYVGFQTVEQSVGEYSAINITLKEAIAQLKEFGIISTGYQELPKERATGSFLQIDNELLNRSTTSNVLDRLKGITTGFYFAPGLSPRITTSLNTKNSGITIRGVSTYRSSTDPLIVVDNFPYEGEINNINPNDIESITVLKDAAAASIWGARSGNGVIVITTKKGKPKEKMKISVNSNVTVGVKPDLNGVPGFLSSKDYIEVEQFLFDKGFFNSDISNKTSRPVVSPAVEIMALQRSGAISADEAKTRLDLLRSYDIRKDYEKYIYQSDVRQQYSVGLRGGSDNMTYTLSGGFDKNTSNLVRDGFDRITLNSLGTYNPVKNLELTAGLNYSWNKTLQNNQVTKALGNRYQSLFPYTRFADENGTPLAIAQNFREAYLNEAEAKGFLDWHYRPLDDVANADNTTKVNDLLLRFGLKYTILPQLSAEISYQNERQTIKVKNLRDQNSYYTRDLINRYSVYDPATKSFTYNFPLGGILTVNDYDWRSNNARGQLNYQQSFSKHNLTAILGSEVRELKTTGTGITMYGYDDQFGTSVNNLNFQMSYPTNPTGSRLIPNTASTVSEITNRYISYYANASYNYDEKYTFSLSGRKDGANLFGAKTNDRVTPLWSAGLSWNISKENFYAFPLVPYLQIRATYGLNGNVYQNGSAYLTGRYSVDPVTGATKISNLSAPNPELKWERVKNVNFGLDFASKNSILSGSIEYYIKDGKDLIQPTPLAPQTGFVDYIANTAATHTTGWDVTLTSKNVNTAFKWETTLLFSAIKDKVVRYDAPLNSGSVSSLGGIVGKPLFAMHAYRWAGINGSTGAPMGYLNGKVSEDYEGIINNFNDSLVFKGSFRPTKFGALRNDFIYKGINLSVNITYQLGYVFRRPSTSLNYTEIIGSATPNSDYARRWQEPGDETRTNVPAIIHPANSNRNTFYQYSEALIEKGDHIRLQDIRLGYELPKSIFKNNPMDRIQVYAYASNLGILWKKNKYGIDPDFVGTYKAPFSIAFGLTANF